MSISSQDALLILAALVHGKSREDLRFILEPKCNIGISGSRYAFQSQYDQVQKAALDALASLCVEHPGGQMFAVSASHVADRLYLYITSNTLETQSEDVKRYIASIWDALVRISRLPSIDSDVSAYDDAADSLSSIVYKRCMDRVLDFISRHSEELFAFREFVKGLPDGDPGARADGSSFLEDVYSVEDLMAGDIRRFADITAAVTLLTEMGPSHVRACATASRVIYTQYATSSYTLVVSKYDKALELYNTSDKVRDRPSFDLRAHITKFMDIERSIDSLLQLALSHRSRASTIFTKKPIIEVITPRPGVPLTCHPPETVFAFLRDAAPSVSDQVINAAIDSFIPIYNLPSPSLTASRLSNVASIMTTVQGLVADDALPKMRSMTTLTFGPDPASTLLLLHHTQPLDAPTPYAYFGLSSAPCFGSATLFRAYNFSVDKDMKRCTRQTECHVLPWRFQFSGESGNDSSMGGGIGLEEAMLRNVRAAVSCALDLPQDGPIDVEQTSKDILGQLENVCCSISPVVEPAAKVSN
ncbi:hypothetical protein BDZ89DRAFT_1073790 [Hymenopellis radicata]|nr:hypothetical protein BDZ89DRAFT_1073790 [Hymenopellis radicata]